ncbi:hypothetical protein [Nitrosovibrio sp. Nv4]|nr:hypothetical protein [Nitrosovibrio sp. Nv4]
MIGWLLESAHGELGADAADIRDSVKAQWQRDSYLPLWDWRQ